MKPVLCNGIPVRSNKAKVKLEFSAKVPCVALALTVFMLFIFLESPLLHWERDGLYLSCYENVCEWP